jgi:hypothetical protein
VQQVAGFTAAARQARSRVHHDKAEAARLRGELTRERWHRQRGDAELLRAERVELCGSGSAYLGCGTCGQVAGDLHPTRCGTWRYCLECRGARCAEYRERLDEAIEAQRALYSREVGRRDTNRWSERFLTLTVEHSGSSAYDFGVIQRAWPVFWRGVKRWLKQRRPLRRDQLKFMPYSRVLEITGSDAGHAHAHVWLLTPYLPHQVLRALWGRAIAAKHNGARMVPVRPLEEVLEECKTQRDRDDVLSVATFRGRRLRYLPWPVLDVRAVHGDVGCELVKYLTKDIGPSGEAVSPLEYANLIEATEGRRMVCCAVHFWVPSEPAKWCDCCNRAMGLITVVPRGRPSLARAPPA